MNYLNHWVRKCQISLTSFCSSEATSEFEGLKRNFAIWEWISDSWQLLRKLFICSSRWSSGFSLRKFAMHSISFHCLYHQINWFQIKSAISFCFFSESINQNTVMTHTFISKLISYLKVRFLNLSKIHYFIDGCAGQYKNKYNFRNLCYHWRFWIDLWGKPLCCLPWQVCMWWNCRIKKAPHLRSQFAKNYLKANSHDWYVSF